MAERRLRQNVIRWWRGEAGVWGSVLDLALAPAEMMFRFGVRLRNDAYDRGRITVWEPPVPVISVGNLSVGGSGKTPIAAWLVEQLRHAGHRPGVVLRGYGEDEVALHGVLNPEAVVVAGADRVSAIQEAVRLGCDSIVLDDGFQHRAVAREMDLVLVSAEQWEERRHLLPRGPWRESAAALRRATHVAVTRKTASQSTAARVATELQNVGFHGPIVQVHLAPGALEPLHRDPGMEREISPDGLRGKRILAVTSLADPRPFIAHLQSVGAEVTAMEFPDHHEFTDLDIERIHEELNRRTIVITGKEAVKLTGRLPSAADVLVLSQEVRVEAGEDVLQNALRQLFERNR